MKPFPEARAVGAACMCLNLRRAARALARRYDDAFRPFGITSGQFAILVAGSSERPARLGRLAGDLGMDRTTLTAAMKPLERDGLIARLADPDDRRATLLRLTEAGRAVLAQALPAWERLQADLDRQAGADNLARLRGELRAFL